MVSNRTLVNVAVYGAIFVSASGYYMQSKLIDGYRNREFYKEALKRLRRNGGAVHYLGEPIKDKQFKITESEHNFCDEKTARFKVPVSGPKARGYYYFWVSNVSDGWKIDRAELELKDDPNKRLVIVKSEEDKKD